MGGGGLSCGTDTVGTTNVRTEHGFVFLPYHVPFVPTQPPFSPLLLRSAHRVPQVVPVFVFSLERAPEQMLFDNHQLVAAGHDIVMVLQLLGNVRREGRGGCELRAHGGWRATRWRGNTVHNRRLTSCPVAGQATVMT